MGARIYIPTLGRFTSVDPVKGGTQNDYVYVTDPINANDFTGEGWFDGIVNVVNVASNWVNANREAIGIAVAIVVTVAVFAVAAPVILAGAVALGASAAIAGTIAAVGASALGGAAGYLAGNAVSGTQSTWQGTGQAALIGGATGGIGAMASIGAKILSQSLSKAGAAITNTAKSLPRTLPNNLTEQLFMQQVKANPGAGKIAMNSLNDPKYPASESWKKLRQVFTTYAGNKIVIHYVAKFDDLGNIIYAEGFKFK